jgi:MOSC domain-containing protein YiiM
MSDASLGRAAEALLGMPPGSAPGADPDLAEWLAELGLIRVPVADPAGFVMAGRFLARFDGGWAVMFGVPPGAIFDPQGVAAADEPPLEAAVIAPLELPPRRAAGPPDEAGRVEAIAIAPEAEAGMRRVETATALAGHGLEGDRYAAGEGTFSRRGGSGRDLTLIEAEAVASLAGEGAGIDPVDARRNLVVSGIDLDALIGRRFRVGDVLCRGARRCEPCVHLQRLTRPGVLRGLVHRGGLRADVLEGGEIRIGDEVRAEPG